MASEYDTGSSSGYEEEFGSGCEQYGHRGMVCINSFQCMKSKLKGIFINILQYQALRRVMPVDMICVQEHIWRTLSYIYCEFRYIYNFIIYNTILQNYIITAFLKGTWPCLFSGEFPVSIIASAVFLWSA